MNKFRKIIMSICGGLFVLAACEKDGVVDRNSPDTYVTEASARIYSVHASPGAPQLTFYFDNEKIAGNQPVVATGVEQGLAYNASGFPSAIGYAIVAPRSGSIRLFTPPSDQGEAVVTVPVLVERGKSYSVFAVNDFPALDVLVVTDGLRYEPGKTAIRFVNLLVQPQALDLTARHTSGGDVAETRIIATGVQNKAYTEFITTDAGAYVFQATHPQTGANIGNQVTLNAVAGKNYSVIVRGVPGSSALPPLISVITHDR